MRVKIPTGRLTVLKWQLFDRQIVGFHRVGFKLCWFHAASVLHGGISVLGLTGVGSSTLLDRRWRFYKVSCANGSTRDEGHARLPLLREASLLPPQVFVKSNRSG